MKVVDYRVGENDAADSDRLYIGDHVLVAATSEDPKAKTVSGWFIAGVRKVEVANARQGTAPGEWTDLTE